MSEQHKLAAVRRGAARTAKMEQQVTEAMQAIHAFDDQRRFSNVRVAGS